MRRRFDAIGQVFQHHAQAGGAIFLGELDLQHVVVQIGAGGGQIAQSGLGFRLNGQRAVLYLGSRRTTFHGAQRGRGSRAVPDILKPC